MSKEADKPGRPRKHSFFKKQAKKGKDLEELKQEVEMEEHQIPIEELVEKLGTDIHKGLTDEQVKEIIARDGPNALSPPKKDPGVGQILQKLVRRIRNASLDWSCTLLHCVLRRLRHFRRPLQRQLVPGDRAGSRGDHHWLFPVFPGG
jgi:hypothetical protein